MKVIGKKLTFFHFIAVYISIHYSFPIKFNIWFEYSQFNPLDLYGSYFLLLVHAVGIVPPVIFG